MIIVGPDATIDVSAIDRTHGFADASVGFDPSAWERVIAWDRPIAPLTEGPLECDAEIIDRITNVLRWMRPALRRGRPCAGTTLFQADFEALYAFPKDNPVAPGDKHCPLRVLFEGPEVRPRSIMIVLREAHSQP